MKFKSNLERGLQVLGLAGLAVTLFAGCIVTDHHRHDHDAPPPPVVRADVIVH
jgi:hypothetical protein